MSAKSICYTPRGITHTHMSKFECFIFACLTAPSTSHSWSSWPAVCYGSHTQLHRPHFRLNLCFRVVTVDDVINIVAKISTKSIQFLWLPACFINFLLLHFVNILKSMSNCVSSYVRPHHRSYEMSNQLDDCRFLIPFCQLLKGHNFNNILVYMYACCSCVILHNNGCAFRCVVFNKAVLS